MNAEVANRARRGLERVTAELLEALGEAEHWSGELSSSALSTAVATIALRELNRRGQGPDHTSLIASGLQWLAMHQNSDGGWGDTVRSRSNLSTTCLAWAAFGAADEDARFADSVAGARKWIDAAAGSLRSSELVRSIEGRYGKDRTFSVPIVLTLALSGRLGPDGWRAVRPLPFELAAFPRAWFGALQLPVVSYALPALIALGQAVHHHAPSKLPPLRILRSSLKGKTLHLLEQLQPSNGGFLEATPLTAFVTMSLASMNLGDHEVARRGAAFLRESVRSDGSWPIDTNLATWVTTLALKALRHQPGILSTERMGLIRDWLLRQQHRTVHPYTGAAPGGWAWTDLPGGVPDADDTAGALLALHAFSPDDQVVAAARQAIGWLLDLQNRDGGIPTFCRGWGTLPFDRSAPDLTAHALRAWAIWLDALPTPDRNRTVAAMERALRYLKNSQRRDGSWVPLWFGNEAAAEECNPVYGTSQVLQAATVFRGTGFEPCLQRAIEFLRRTQNTDGGWGGAPGVRSSMEETALAVAALSGKEGIRQERERGVLWLSEQIESGSHQHPAPIGLYFARLWYWERLYPLVFAADALGATLTPDSMGALHQP